MEPALWYSRVLAFLSDFLLEFPTEESLRTGDGDGGGGV